MKIEFGPNQIILLQVDKVYYFSNFWVKATTPYILNHKCEMRYKAGTEIKHCHRGLLPPNFPQLSFNFEPIAIVDQMKKNDVVDILAIIQSYGEMEALPQDKGIILVKRALCLVDESNRKVFISC